MSLPEKQKPFRLLSLLLIDLPKGQKKYSCGVSKTQVPFDEKERAFKFGQFGYKYVYPKEKNG